MSRLLLFCICSRILYAEAFHRGQTPYCSKPGEGTARQSWCALQIYPPESINRQRRRTYERARDSSPEAASPRMAFCWENGGQERSAGTVLCCGGKSPARMCCC